MGRRSFQRIYKGKRRTVSPGSQHPIVTAAHPDLAGHLKRRESVGSPMANPARPVGPLSANHRIFQMY